LARDIYSRLFDLLFSIICFNNDPRSVRPLRYTPGLSCDAHLENLRPERDPRHPPIQGGDNWKRKLIQVRPGLKIQGYLIPGRRKAWAIT
jgi:hypothetical protein